MGLILVGTKPSISKNGKTKKKEAKQEKAQKTNSEIISQSKIKVRRELASNEDNTLTDK